MPFLTSSRGMRTLTLQSLSICMQRNWGFFISWFMVIPLNKFKKEEGLAFLYLKTHPFSVAKDDVH